MKTRLFAASLILVTVLTGCGKKQDPLFLVQSAPAGHGKKQTIKEAFGHYRYFRSAGWNRSGDAGSADVVVTATLNFKRILSEITDRAGTDQDREHFGKHTAQYEQYLTLVAYDFTFHVAADNTVTCTGAAVTEPDGERSGTRQATSEERATMIQDVYEDAFPAWVESAIKEKFQ